MGRFFGFYSVCLVALSMGSIANALYVPRFVPKRAQHTYAHPARPNLSISRILDKMKAERLTTIEQVLAGLPQDFRDHYVLMYGSRSLQQSTFLAPRVIFHEGDGSFALAVGSGHAGLRGGNVIEMVQFHDDGYRWEFRELTFRAGRNPEVSEPNPKKCLACHQSPLRTDVDPRPNWEAYNFWPGAYAGFDGEIGKRLIDPKNMAPILLPLIDAHLYDEDDVAQSMLEKFFAEVQPDHPRYKFLGPFNGQAVTDMGELFVGNNDLRAVRLASQSPDWDVYRNLMVTMMTCDHTYDVFELRKHKPFPRNLFYPDSLPPELEPLHRSLVDKFTMREELPIRELTAGMRIDMLFETRGIDTTDWSMDYKTDARLAFEDRFGSVASPLAQMQSAVIEVLKLKINPELGLGGLCADAQKDLAEKLPGWRQSGRLKQLVATTQERLLTYQRTMGREALLNRCVSCHDGSKKTVPAIAFDDPESLKKELPRIIVRRGQTMRMIDEIEWRLRDFATTDEQMPPSLASSPKDRKAVMAYLQDLIAH